MTCDEHPAGPARLSWLYWARAAKTVNTRCALERRIRLGTASVAVSEERDQDVRARKGGSSEPAKEDVVSRSHEAGPRAIDAGFGE